MAPIKRKRKSSEPKPNKRTKHVPLSEQEYSASCILDERILQGVRKYRVQWTDIDPRTEHVYEPTWEPRDALNEALVASWEEDKAQKGIASVNEHSRHKKTKGRPKKNGKGQQSSRNTRVVDSSPEASIAQPSSLPSTPLTSARNSVAGSIPSSAVTTPIDRPASPNHQSPLVQVNIRGDSLERGEYDPHSQIPQSTLVSSQVYTQEIDLGSPPFLTSAFPHSPGVIPDSQSTAGDESFVGPTQQTEDTFPRSTSTDDSEVEEVTEDSVCLHILRMELGCLLITRQGLLEIVQEAAPHAISFAVSPARSIAETIAETLGNSQSQQQTVGAKGLQNNFDNFDPIESSLQPEEAQQQVDREDEPQVAAGSVDEWQEYTTEPATVNRSSGSEDPQPIRSSLAAATLAESVLEHNTNPYPPPVAQHATYPDPTLQQSVSQVVQQGQVDSGAQATISVDSSDNRANEIDTDKPHFSEVADSIVVLESSQSEPSQAKGKDVGVIPQLQEQDDDLLNQSLVPEYGRSSSPAVRRQSPIQEQEDNAIAQSIEASESAVEVIHPSQDATDHLLVSDSTTQLSVSREQNAQIVPVGKGLSTEENTSESIRPTIEKEHSVRRGSSGSRHDSSQETPERQVKSTTHSSSSIPFPPSHSTGTFDSRAPPRPVTPAAVSSPSIMAGEDIGDEVARELKERLAKRAAENPFTPTRRILKSSLSPFASASAPVPAQDTLAPPMSSTRRLFQANISPAEGLEGTRSPSMVPDRSPVSQIPTSLRTVAVAPTNNVSASLSHDVDSSTHAGADLEAAEMDGMVAAEDMGLHQADSDANDPDDVELSDADNDDDSDESLLNDDLNLDREEYIVPLSIEGRQRDMYAGYITQNKDVLEKFLKDGQGHSSVSDVDAVLSHLRAIETHIDLVFAEAETASRSEMNSETQIEFAAQFGMENSAKFRFLHWLVDPLQKYNKHLIILTETGEDPLYNILETFFQAKSVDYRMPTKNRRADPEQVQGELVVDIFPGDESPIVQPPDMIICLDGVQDANSIRQNDWARSADGDIVPILHLVIPRTVGHIERYISPTLYAREHVHTTLASLAQMRSELGWPLDDDTPGARESAELVFGWLMAGNDDEGLSWPLPSIGSVKDVIEFQTQLSQASKTTPPPERNKRPLVS